ncbi:PREDICTED: NEDD4-binding protein 1 isoform X1 [Drosophila arizonae]|uniref:NEDD4-binding protein 1 isoform X1 n=1 Tax=Drosophila arizonae TaxID=7263 RepID=A0ABM1PJJ8_DROAR|nr:PREDICTED: NEDD4-binding protein 1 isoform X1 [Drosophila arizonae]
MGKKNKGGGKKRGRIHKHRYKKNKQQSPRKGRKALLGEVAEETNTCPTTVENKALSEPSCSRTTLEMELQLNTDASTTMTSQFQKFKDSLVKKKLKRLQKKKSPKSNSNKSYSVKLVNSIKRRAVNSQSKNASATPTNKGNVQLQQVTKQQQQKQQPQQNSLPKPTFYPTGQQKSEVKEGEIIEEIESSDDDDCIVLEPHMTKITIDTDDEPDDESSKEPVAAKAEDKNTVVNFFKVDTRRRHQLWARFVNGTSQNSVLYNKSNARPLLKENTSCIIIDDGGDEAKKVEQKQPVAQNLLDDSVIFVQEDFIPLSSGKDDGAGDGVSPQRKRHSKSTEDGPKAPKTPKMVTQRMNEGLFTSTERKKLADYNSNTYNPGVESNAPVTHKRSIIIDGSNVAFGHGRSNIFSSEGIKYCVEYFEKMGHDVKAVIPLFRRNSNKSSNPALLDQLYKEGKIVFTPCKNLPNQQAISYDDRFILQLAYERNAAVVSNDNYRDLINENAAFKKIIENRVIGYSWCDNILILPKDPYGRFGPPLAEILRC